MSLSLGRALAFFTTPAQVNTLITEALATRGITIDAANYTALTTNYPAASYNGAFAWVEAAQGTAWLPGTMGGTYYPLGLYHSNGTDWIFTPSPSQATQSEVDTGTNNDKFVTPQTLFNDSKWATKNAAVTVSNSTAVGHYPVTFVPANGALTALNTNSGIYVSPSEQVVVSPYFTATNSVFAGTVDAAQVKGLFISSTNGGDSSTSALTLTGNNGYGGTNYYGAINLENTGATNGKKYLRINATGGLEIINNAYSSTIWSLSDSGSSYSQTVTGDNINANSAISAGTTISATGTITSSSSTAFIATGNAVNNIALQMANASALRNIGDVAENHMYFDINTGGSNRGHFTFRGTNSYTTYADINPDGIQAKTTYVGKTAYNVPLDTELTVGNFTFRVSNQGGIFGQVKSSSGSGVNTSFTSFGCVSGASIGQTSNTGFNLTTYASVWTTHGMDAAGDYVQSLVVDKNNSRIYRVTFMRNDNGSTTGYNIIVEQLI